MEVKKGDVFICLKDVVMEVTEEVAYHEGGVYTSEEDGCITNQQGDEGHQWNEIYGLSEFFEKLN